MKKSIFFAVTAAIFLAGCTAQPSVGAKDGVYKGSLVNKKLRQDTATVLSVKGNEATVEFVDLIEKDQQCKATFVKVNSQIAGVSSYKGNFNGAIGVCKVFAQEPELDRMMHLREVGDEIEVVFSYDNLAKKPITTGYLK